LRGGRADRVRRLQGMPRLKPARRASSTCRFR
jgi:hypothetical protein